MTSIECKQRGCKHVFCGAKTPNAQRPTERERPEPPAQRAGPGWPGTERPNAPSPNKLSKGANPNENRRGETPTQFIIVQLLQYTRATNETRPRGETPRSRHTPQ